MLEEQPVQLNYVIPEELGNMLADYCEQNMTTPSLLIRQLILEYVEGDRVVSDPVHPRGRRTTVVLPQRLLQAFESQIEDHKHGTKAAVIAALLGNFLPPRIDPGDKVRVELEIPTDVFNLVSERFGPGPVDDVIIKALRHVGVRQQHQETVKCQD